MCNPREDAETLARAMEVGKGGRVGGEEGRREERGMYTSLSLHHLYTLLDCLLQAHRSLTVEVFDRFCNFF